MVDEKADNTLATGKEQLERWQKICEREVAKIESAKSGQTVRVDEVVAIANEANQDDEFMVMRDCPEEMSEVSR